MNSKFILLDVQIKNLDAILDAPFLTPISNLSANFVSLNFVIGPITSHCLLPPLLHGCCLHPLLTGLLWKSPNGSPYFCCPPTPYSTQRIERALKGLPSHSEESQVSTPDYDAKRWTPGYLSDPLPTTLPLLTSLPPPWPPGHSLNTENTV